MNIRLSAALQAHRRGRLLTNVLGLRAEPAAVSPPIDHESVLMLMTGEEFSQSPDHQSAWMQWTKQSGHMLVLLPPYQKGALTPALDWQVGLAPEPPEPPKQREAEVILLQKLAPEVSFVLHGEDGSCDREVGHCWRDGTVNTRYWKQHTNSGLLVATCLPIWSISLLGEGEAVLTWLQALHRHLGRTAATTAVHTEVGLARSPTEQEIVVMLCCYAYGLASADGLTRVLAEQTVPIMRLDGYDLPLLFDQMRESGWLGETRLSEQGLALVHSGPYWRYAEQLKELART
ncbi:hypothetical protein [Paraburkholderia sediminicola]|uniref:hypothetical protein n=1 Tax=Paraburkholderia sediminicola TaxID=458836 RepID=UPI0038BD624E